MNRMTSMRMRDGRFEKKLSMLSYLNALDIRQTSERHRNAVTETSVYVLQLHGQAAGSISVPRSLSSKNVRPLSCSGKYS